MADKEIKNIIGEKIDQSMREDEVAMLGDLLQMPTQETIDMWTREADKRIEVKKKKQMRILAACATVAIVCASALLAIKCFAPPEATANPEVDSRIEATMESTTRYESWDELPSDIKEQFIEFKEFPEGYELKYVEVEEGAYAVMVIYNLVNEKGQEICIREGLSRNNGIEKDIVLSNEEIAFGIGNDLYVEKHEDTLKKTTYSLKYHNIFVDVVVADNMEEDIKTMLEKAIL